MNIQDKVIVVTGAGNGMGRELVLALLEKGARIAAVDMREATLKETVQLAGQKADRISIHVLDITDKAAVEALPKDVIANHGNVDGIINNAGIIQPFVRVNDLDYETINRVMNVNFYGALYMIKTFLPLLLKRPEAHIVNTSSMGGFLPVPGQSVYGASKAAIKLLTEGLYAELADTNVRVSAVFPGAIQTNITVNSGVKGPELPANSKQSKNFKMLPAKDAAARIIRGIEKNKPLIYVGQDSKLMNMLYRLNPTFATNFIAKQMKSLLPG
jgi:short-subunit dehydrogenase